MPRNVDGAKEELVAGGHYVSFRKKSMISRQRDLPLLIISTVAELSDLTAMVFLDHSSPQIMAATTTG